MRQFHFHYGRRRWTSTLILATLLLMHSGVFAQTTGTLLGTVSDQSNAVVPGAKVSLINETSGDVRETATNQVGRFTFAGVRPGTYTIKVTSERFKGWQLTGFALNAADTRDLSDIKLDVGSGQETVNVEAATTQVALVTSGERSSVLDYKQIQSLALISRNVSELLKVLPGVSSVAGNGSNGAGFDFSNASSTGSPIGAGLSTNGAPYRGGAMLLLDGANIIDPGCNCWSTAVPNPEFTQEVKVQTSNFAADQPNGPVVFSTISKSGTSKYHGSVYTNLRNSALNSNTWQNNFNNVKKPHAAWVYPGGTIGGPVPFTKDKLLFWSGFEYYWQKLPAANPLTAWVPTASMRAGNFSPTAADNAAACAAVGGFSANTNDFCNDLSGTVLPDGTPLAGTTIPANAIDSNMVRLMNLYFPEPNADPSAGYNWFMPITSQQNGWVYRARVDYNITDSTKLYLSYQVGKNSSFQPAHIWWNPTNSVPFPGGGITNPTKARTFSANLLHVFSPTLTNEMILTWNKSTSPYVPVDLSIADRSNVGWAYQTVFGGGQNDALVPGVYSPRNRTFGEMSQGDIFQHNGEFGLTKAVPAFQDNVTKVVRNHTFKAGFAYAMTGNYQVNFVRPNGVLSFDSLNTATRSVTNQLNNQFYGSQNPMANFLMGVATNYQEDSQTDVFDMAYRNYSFYGMDDWKVTNRLTLNIGFRFDHIGRWYERTGTGMAVWLPRLYQDDVNAGRLNPGVRWHGIDPGIPLSGSQSQTLFVSPRLGMAFDVFGEGKTVLRGGWGAYRWNDQYNDYSGTLSTAQGLQTYNLASGRSILASQISPSLLSMVSGTTQSGSIYATDPNDHRIPVTYSYNFTVSQQLPWRSLFEIAYVGNNSEDLLMGGQSGGSGIGGEDFINVNKIPLGGLFAPDPVSGAARPANLEAQGTAGAWDYQHYFPYWEGYGTNRVRIGQHVGYSNYNALQLSWVKQASSFTANFNYTWSKALGIVNATVNAFSVHGNYGVLNIDRPHVFNASYSYEVGNRLHGNKVLEGVLNGWILSGITTWQSGANLQSANSSQNLGINLNGGALTTRTYYGTNVGVILPVYTCDPGSNLGENYYINVSCVSAPAVGQYGDRQAPYLSGPAYFNQDFAVRKNFSITERQRIEFSMSAANIFNHPLWFIGWGNMDTLNLTGSGTSWTPTGASDYGRVTQKSGDRKFMLGLKYSF
jgi:Carboxypeptidase regulatory-like domain